MAHCERSGLRISELMIANERVWRSDAEIRDGIAQLWQAMQDCLRCGLGAAGSLPGGLHVARRAPMLYRDLGSRPEAAFRDPRTDRQVVVEGQSESVRMDHRCHRFIKNNLMDIKRYS